MKDDQWIQAQKPGASNQNGRKKGQEGKNLKGGLVTGIKTVGKSITPSNQFAVLSSSEAPILEEGRFNISKSRKLSR